MNRIKVLIAASTLLAAFLSKAQEKHSFIENIGVKISHSQNHNFERDPLPSLLNWQLLNTRTFRLGLGYDLKTNNRINYNFNLSIDWLTDKNDYKVNDVDFDENAFIKSFDWGNTIYFTLESQILFGLNTKNNLHFMIAPQINYRLFNDQGTSEFSGTNPLNGYSFSLKTIDRNRILRPSLALGLQYDLNTTTKMRLGAFYSYSFTPIYFGEFTYENSNGVTASGDWEQKGHQAGITFQIFPFFKRNN